MIADTSYLLALIDVRDVHHDEARALYERHGPQVVQQTALTELLQVVEFGARRAGTAKAAREEARRALGLVTETFGFHVRPVAAQRRALELYARDEKLSFVDACGAAEASAAGGILTFDDRQRAAARRASSH